MKRDCFSNYDMSEPFKRQRKAYSSCDSDSSDGSLDDTRNCSVSFQPNQRVIPYQLLPSLLMKYYNIQGLSFEQYLNQLD